MRRGFSPGFSSACPAQQEQTELSFSHKCFSFKKFQVNMALSCKRNLQVFFLHLTFNHRHMQVGFDAVGQHLSCHTENTNVGAERMVRTALLFYHKEVAHRNFSYQAVIVGCVRSCLGPSPSLPSRLPANQPAESVSKLELHDDRET